MDFYEQMEHMERRPGMYLHPYNYDSLTAFMLGYELCANSNGKMNPFEGMIELVQCRLGTDCNVGWMRAISHFFASDEDEAIRIAFAWLRDLRDLKADRGLEWLESEYRRMRGLKRRRAINPFWPAKRPKTAETEQADADQPTAAENL